MTGNRIADTIIALLYMAGLLAMCHPSFPRRWAWFCSEAKRRARTWSL